MITIKLKWENSGVSEEAIQLLDLHCEGSDEVKEEGIIKIIWGDKSDV